MASSLIEKANQVRRDLVAQGYDAGRVDEVFDQRFPTVSMLDAERITAAMKRDLGEPTGKPAARKASASRSDDDSNVSPFVREMVARRKKEAEGFRKWGLS